MIRPMPMMLWLAAMLCNPASGAAELRHVGDFMLQSHIRLTGEHVSPIPMKPMAFRVYTDGVNVKVTTDGGDEAATTFQIYRSDGIGRQRPGRGALEVIPGVQATSNTGGILRHLRLSKEALTITTFPGVSDQTIISHAVAAQATPPQAEGKTQQPPPQP